MENKEIREISFFKDLDDSGMQALMGSIQTKEYKAGDIIFREGSISSDLYIGLSGKVGVNKMTAEGDQFPFATLKKGQGFGIMSFLDGRKHDATTVAEEDTRLLVLERSEFDRLVQAHPAIALKIFWNIAIDLAALVREMNSQHMDLMHMMFRQSK